MNGGEGEEAGEEGEGRVTEGRKEGDPVCIFTFSFE